ncbi:MAG TPA: M56 family metallopeptidase, partial [Terriglobales bacterium]|nr:M56 family metallopeptidase [Terriglobales bacterium]
MSLHYTMRLLCLCFASFFVVHGALALVARLSAGPALRIAEHLRPRSAARLLFTLRLLPLLMTISAVLIFCVPSYLWLEPEGTGERVGLVCVLAALLGVAVWVPAMVRVFSAVRRTTRYLDHCRRQGSRISLPGDASAALLLADQTPVLAVAGVFRPQLLISRQVMQELSPEERESALRHERAHRAAGDNFKRLLVLLAPDILPLVRCFGRLDRAWSKFTEWAADDQATEGDPHRALSLAAALVQVAKMGSKPRLGYLSCSLTGDDQDLSERVERLL